VLYHSSGDSSFLQKTGTRLPNYRIFSNLIRTRNPPMKTEQTQCSEKSAYKIQTPGNYPEENIQQICVAYFYIMHSYV